MIICSVFTKEDVDPYWAQNGARYETHCCYRKKGVVNLLNTLKSNKADGPDEIKPDFWKNMGLSYPQLWH